MKDRRTEEENPEIENWEFITVEAEAQGRRLDKLLSELQPALSFCPSWHSFLRLIFHAPRYVPGSVSIGLLFSKQSHKSLETTAAFYIINLFFKKFCNQKIRQSDTYKVNHSIPGNTKIWARGTLKTGGKITALPKLLSFEYLENDGYKVNHSIPGNSRTFKQLLFFQFLAINK